MAWPGAIYIFSELPDTHPTGLQRTASTYGIHNLETMPTWGECYVTCSNGPEFVMASMVEPDRPIGWALVYVNGEPHVRVTQMLHEPRPVGIKLVGVTLQSEVPKKTSIGSIVLREIETNVH